jgi:acetyl/propionyl-CoA carboxylase alpha subunit
LGEAVGYIGAGTVEFLLAAGEESRDGEFFFMEVNSRLQVEHPVTEMLTGLDLVELQIRVAQGEELPKLVAPLPAVDQCGHAIELRICAELPEQRFSPSTGTVLSLKPPTVSLGDDVRFDTGIKPGSRITHYYDSLLGKLIVHSDNRATAITAAREALNNLELTGVRTNYPLLAKLLDSNEFNALKHSISMVDEWNNQELLTTEQLVAYALLRTAAEVVSIRSAHAQIDRQLLWRVVGKDINVFVSAGQHISLATGTGETTAIVISSNQIKMSSGQILTGKTKIVGETSWVKIDSPRHDLGWLPITRAFPILKRRGESETTRHTNILSPLPGKIIAIAASSGQEVTEGALIATLESMKMEHPILAPSSGKLAQIRVNIGDVIQAQSVIAEIS